MKYAALKFLFILFLTSADVLPQDSEPVLFPLDESNLDSSYINFQNRLLLAIKEKDEQFIIEALDENVKVSFGGDFGVKSFIKHWNLNGEQSLFWETLEEVLRLGGTFENYGSKMFIAPYIYSRWNNEFDAFEYAAVLERDISLKSKPDPAASTIRLMSYNIIKIINYKNFSGWKEVQTADGTIGYLKEKDIRSPLDYRIGFAKKGQRWKIVFFLAGD